MLNTTMIFFTGIPQDISEAARIDGASEFTIFSRLILPMAKPRHGDTLNEVFLHDEEYEQHRQDHDRTQSQITTFIAVTVSIMLNNKKLHYTGPFRIVFFIPYSHRE